MPRQLPSLLGGVDIPPIGSSASDFPSVYRSPGYYVDPRHIDTGRTLAGPNVQVINNRTERDFAKIDGKYIIESGLNIFPGEDEWWKTPVPTATAQASAEIHGASGDIWGDAMPSPTPTATPEPTASPSPSASPSPEPSSTPTPEPSASPEPTGSPAPTPEPTVSPTPEPSASPWPEEVNQPEPQRTGGGLDIRNFGGDLTLGQFIGSTLDEMHYGQHPPASAPTSTIHSGGRPVDLQPGEGWIDPNSQTGGHWEDVDNGQAWVPDAPSSSPASTTTDGNVPTGNDAPARQNQPVAQQNDAPWMHGAGVTPIHGEHWIGGGVDPETGAMNPLGYGDLNDLNHNFNGLNPDALMGNTELGGSPANMTGGRAKSFATTDEGHTMYWAESGAPLFGQDTLKPYGYDQFGAQAHLGLADRINSLNRAISRWKSATGHTSPSRPAAGPSSVGGGG